MTLFKNPFFSGDERIKQYNERIGFRFCLIEKNSNAYVASSYRESTVSFRPVHIFRTLKNRSGIGTEFVVCRKLIIRRNKCIYQNFRALKIPEFPKKCPEFYEKKIQNLR